MSGVIPLSGVVLPEAYELQICILGEAGVGKSTMVSSYITQRYPEPGSVRARPCALFLSCSRSTCAVSPPPPVIP